MIQTFNPTVLLASARTMHLMSTRQWRAACELACEWGWEPAGTLPPDDVDSGEWDGGYNEPQGQRVVERDANAMGTALADVLCQWSQDGNEAQEADVEWIDYPYSEFSGKGIELLRELAKFCICSRGFAIVRPEEEE